MKMTKWPTDITVKFVSEYVLHELLWNVNHPLHKNYAARARAYKSIKNAMNLPNFDEKEVHRKIRSIRSTYCQEKKKIIDGMKCGAEDYHSVSSLKWFPILDSVLKDKITNNLVEPAEKTTNVECTDGTQTQEPDLNVSVSDVLLTSPLDHMRECDMQNLDELHTNNIMLMSETEEEHEFDIFGKSVAAQLKSLPLVKALLAQTHIQTYLTDLRLQQVQSSNSQTLA